MITVLRLLAAWIAVIALIVVRGADECTNRLLEKSQHCENMNIMYYTVEGQVGARRNSLSSEFSHFLVKTLFEAATTNHRMVLVDVARPWEYDCADPTLSYWACYFIMPCHDSFLHGSRDGLYRLNFANPNNLFHTNGGTMHEGEYASLLLSAFETYGWYTEGINKQRCAQEFEKLGHVMSVMARYLYSLNDVTQAKVDGINKEYYLLPYTYVSTLLELTDVRGETWAFLNDKRLVTDLIVSKAREHSKETVFVATDNCSYLSDLFSGRYLGATGLQLYSLCTHRSKGIHTHHTAASRIVRERFGEEDAIRLFADVEMLRHGEYFIGSLESDTVRMAWRLRDDDHQAKYESFHRSKDIAFCDSIENCSV